MARVAVRTGMDFTGSTGITGLPSAVGNSEPVTLAQLTAINNSAPLHPTARVAATAQVTIASPPSTIDGVSLATGDRVLLTGQTTASQNGVYVWNGTGTAMSRATDTLSPGGMWVVTEGTANADTLWEIKTDGAITVGTTSILIALGPRNAAPAAVAVTKFTATLGDGSSVTLTHSYGAGTQDVTTAVWLISGGTQTPVVVAVQTAADGNSVTYTFDTAPGANTIRSVITA